MTGEEHDLPAPGAQRDPVADFFARERGDLRELPPATDHWEGLLAESRRPQRRPWGGYLLGAAAVAAVAVIAWGTTVRPAHDATPASASAASDRTGTGALDTSGPSITTQPKPTSTALTTAPTTHLAPASFVPGSMSNAGSGRIYALGSATCSGTACVAVVGSDDDGRTWTTRASLEKVTMTAPHRTPEATGELTGIRFANPKIGFAFGSKAFRTTDAGRNWTPYDVGGRPVLSLETDGTTVWMVTAATCKHGAAAAARGCSDLQVWSAGIHDGHATRHHVVGLDHPVESAWLSMDGSDAYLNVSYLDPATQTPAMRVSGNPADVPVPAGCAGTGGVWVWGAASERGALVAVCRSESQPTEAYAVSSSKDHGATWSQATTAPALGRPSPAGVWLTAVDRTRLVAVSQGLATSGPPSGEPTGQPAAEPAALLSSADGGRTWATPKGTPLSQDWTWVGAAGGRLVYALGGAGNGYLLSTDGGARFGVTSYR